jgi:hypothetical protein
MAQLAAYAQLRSAGRLGAAGVDEMMAFGAELRGRPALWIDAARAVDAANSAAHRQFAGAWQAQDPRLLALCDAPRSTAPARPANRRRQE